MMIVVPVVDMLKLSLETWVFPLASEDMYEYDKMPPEPYIYERLNDEALDKTKGLTENDVATIKEWKKDYKAWQEKKDSVDWKKAKLQRNLSRDISTLIVGLALFLTHGYVLRRDKKRNA